MPCTTAATSLDSRPQGRRKGGLESRLYSNLNALNNYTSVPVAFYIIIVPVHASQILPSPVVYVDDVYVTCCHPKSNHLLYF